MKKNFIVLLIMLSFSTTNKVTAASQDTTSIMSSIATVSKSLTNVDTLLSKINSKLSNGSATAPCVGCACDTKQLKWSQRLLIALPVILFLVFVWFTFKKIKTDGLNFRQAFYCDEPEDIVKSANDPANPSATIKVTLLDANGKPLYYPSTSKLIVFLTGLSTLLIIICFITYYAYCMMKCATLPDFKNLFEVIMGLGLGIIPYGVSKVAGATKPN